MLTALTAYIFCMLTFICYQAVVVNIQHVGLLSHINTEISFTAYFTSDQPFPFTYTHTLLGKQLTVHMVHTGFESLSGMISRAQGPSLKIIQMNQPVHTMLCKGGGHHNSFP